MRFSSCAGGLVEVRQLGKSKEAQSPGLRRDHPRERQGRKALRLLLRLGLDLVFRRLLELRHCRLRAPRQLGKLGGLCQNLLKGNAGRNHRRGAQKPALTQPAWQLRLVLKIRSTKFQVRAKEEGTVFKNEN